MRAASVRLSVSDDSFTRFFWISATVHLVFIFGFAVKQFILPSEVTILQNAMRVDIVALPDKAEPENGPSPSAPAPAATPKTESAKPKALPTPEKKISLDKKKPDPKQKQLEALNKLKQRDALEKLSTAKKPTESPTSATQPKKTLYAGNQISRGDSVTGLERISFDEYIAGIKGTVRDNFTLPSWLADQKIKCTVEVTIDGNGRVTHRVLTRTSGNQTFDNAALSAVDASSPFPPVPERLTRGWGSFVIQFSFPEL